MFDTSRKMYDLATEDPLLAEFLVSKGFPFTVTNPITKLVSFDDVVSMRKLDKDAFLAEFEEFRAAHMEG